MTFAMIDKRKVKRSFNLHASTYDQSAHLQKKVAAEVIERVTHSGIDPSRVLDIGTGTGYIALALRELFPTITIQACDIAHEMIAVARAKGAKLSYNHLAFVTADAEVLPYQRERFDLVVSNLTYQWLSEWGSAFQEVCRVLKVGGVFIFTTLGEQTLFELRDSYLRAYQILGSSGVPSLHNFIRRDTLEEILTREGFSEVLVESKCEKEYHGGAKELLIHLKTIGAQNATTHNLLGLGKTKVFKQMLDTYEERYRNSLGIPATYELLFGWGRKR